MISPCIGYTLHRYKETFDLFVSCLSTSLTIKGYEIGHLVSFFIQPCWRECPQSVYPEQFPFLSFFVMWGWFLVQDEYYLHYHVLHSVAWEVVVCSSGSPKFFPSDISLMFTHSLFECSVGLPYILDTTSSACYEIDKVPGVARVSGWASIFPSCDRAAYGVYVVWFCTEFALPSFVAWGCYVSLCPTC